MDISKFIPYGRENAISRAELCVLTGFSDRAIRNHVEDARNVQNEKTGFILSSSQCKGYWRSHDIGELEEFIREDENRKKSSAKRNDSIKKYIAEIKGIRVVPVCSHFRRIGTGDLQGQCRIEVS